MTHVAEALDDSRHRQSPVAAVVAKLHFTGCRSVQLEAQQDEYFVARID
jgi:hypothetical protein